MEILSFLKQYITKPRTVGAILPSSKYLANRMIEKIDFNSAHYYCGIWNRYGCI